MNNLLSEFNPLADNQYCSLDINMQVASFLETVLQGNNNLCGH